MFFSLRMLYHGLTIVISGTEPNRASSFEAAINQAGADCALLTPATLKEIALSDEHLQNLSKVKYVSFAGGM